MLDATLEVRDPLLHGRFELEGVDEGAAEEIEAEAETGWVDEAEGRTEEGDAEGADEGAADDEGTIDDDEGTAEDEGKTEDEDGATEDLNRPSNHTDKCARKAFCDVNNVSLHV